MTATNVIIWCCTGVFIAIAIVTVLALLDKVKLGQSRQEHKTYLKTLFNILIIGIVTAGLVAFAISVKDKLTAFEIVIWSAAIIFAATGLITILALVNKLTLGSSPEENSYFRKRLFVILIVQIVALSVSAFGLYLKEQPIVASLQEENALLKEKLDKVCQKSGAIWWSCAAWRQGTGIFYEAERWANDAKSYNKMIKDVRAEYVSAINKDVDNAWLQTHVAAMDNELGNYADAEKTLRRVYALPEFTDDKGLRAWAMGELACSLYLQGRQAEFESLTEELYQFSADMKTFVPNNSMKYKRNDTKRKELSKPDLDEVSAYNGYSAPIN